MSMDQQTQHPSGRGEADIPHDAYENYDLPVEGRVARTPSSGLWIFGLPKNDHNSVTMTDKSLSRSASRGLDSLDFHHFKLLQNNNLQA